ncbi:hypothetical protein N7520_005237 [Penicillium odoratum]|uniref:uncharacterized protein n=1 Tax=Penicillium odoratum TaxID=1167516 RepID=UPI0025489A07|nr:uncharacterized protein N7520_005237 [Penicillium odoratum]KAJ5765678.1 hypothetical protein N7520_005237 [Penicillium odoratum]
MENGVNKWRVDVISMFFGFPTRQIDGYERLENVIRTARSNNVLLFAAASNRGANEGRAYPARDDNVICVHSTDTYENRSDFSPEPVRNVIKIATVGEAVESAWPGQGVLFKSGTSYATPIAASMAVFLLECARINLSDNYADMMKQKSRMEALLTRIADRARDGYQYAVINRSSNNLFGRDQESIIDSRIQEILNSER